MDLEGIILNDFNYLKTLKEEKKNGQTKDKNKSYRCRKKQAFARGESGGRRGEGGRDAQTSSCKISESQVRGVQCGGTFYGEHSATRKTVVIILKCIETSNHYAV